jgi:DNA invertase Pin-like site-specific DNA recombinase
LEAQQQAVSSHLKGIPHKLVATFTEIESGKRNDRPELAKALAECRLRKATLIIAKLDRLARNVHFVSGLMESNVEFVAVDFPQANRLTVHILAAVAEHEAHMISERTKAALRAAKRRGVRLGGDRGNLPTVAKHGAAASIVARQRIAEKRTADLLPVIRQIQAEGTASMSAIAAKLNERGIQASRGGSWHPNSVRRVLQLSSH